MGGILIHVSNSYFKACLAAIIIVALKGLFMQTKDFFTIGRVAKLEAVSTGVRS